MTDRLLIHSQEMKTDWLTQSTRQGIFYTSDWGSGIFVWIAGNEPYASFHLNSLGTLFRQYERPDRGGDISGVYLGKAVLALDPTSFRSTSERLQVGDIELNRYGLALACEPHRLSSRPSPVQFARADASSDVPYKVSCIRWSLLLRDPNGDLRPFFERKSDD